MDMPARPAQDRIDAQPVYIQEYIAELEKAAKEAVDAANDLADAQKVTRVQYGDVYDNPRYLPDDEEVMFQIGITADESKVTEDGREPDWVQVVRKREGWDQKPFIQIVGSAALHMSPQAVNVLRVGVTDK